MRNKSPYIYFLAFAGCVFIVLGAFLLLRARPGDVLTNSTGNLDSGLNPNINGVKNESKVFTSQEDLQNYISERSLRADTISGVDWNSQNVVYVSVLVPTSGYSIISAEYRNLDGKNSIVVQALKPGQGCMATQAFESLYTFVAVPKSVTEFSTELEYVDNSSSCPQ